MVEFIIGFLTTALLVTAALGITLVLFLVLVVLFSRLLGRKL